MTPLPRLRGVSGPKSLYGLMTKDLPVTPGHGPPIPQASGLGPEPDPSNLRLTDDASALDFQTRYQAWGRGSVAEFGVYDYLSNRLGLVEGHDFWFVPSPITNALSKFYIGPAVLRVVNDSLASGGAGDTLERMQYEQEGYMVMDVDAQKLANDRNNVMAQVMGVTAAGREF